MFDTLTTSEEHALERSAMTDHELVTDCVDHRHGLGYFPGDSVGLDCCLFALEVRAFIREWAIAHMETEEYEREHVQAPVKRKRD